MRYGVVPLATESDVLTGRPPILLSRYGMRFVRGINRTQGFFVPPYWARGG
jgi:hypothetical protein